MAGASLLIGNPVQKYIQKKRPAKRGLIFGQISTDFRTNCRKSVICPRTLSDNYCFVRRLRALVKSSPQKVNLGAAKGLISLALESSPTLLIRI